MFLNISQNSQENTCARETPTLSLAQVFSCEFCEISKNTFFDRAPPVAVSSNNNSTTPKGSEESKLCYLSIEQFYQTNFDLTKVIF